MPQFDEITLTNIALIEGSPWQSRSTMDMVKLAELQQDIFTSRLHQPVVLRPIKGGFTRADDPDSWTSVVYEIVSGHRRVEAFRQLHKRGWQLNGKGLQPGPGVRDYWCREKIGTLIPAIIEEMTDAEAARTILSENRMREDVNVMDEIRAVRRALDGTNASAQDLAVSLGISAQQLSNRLRLLKLPEGLQNCVGSGKLAWTTARELLSFVRPHCDHSQELEFVERNVTDCVGSVSLSTLQDWMASAHTRRSHREKWRRLTGTFERWMGDEEPLFDVAEFKRQHKNSVHSLPMGSYQNSGNKLFTCNVDEFDRLQVEAKRAVADLEALEQEGKGESEIDNSGPQPPTQEEIDEFEAQCHAKWDEWDEIIKAAYERVGPVIKAMDDGHIAKALLRHPANWPLRTWVESVPYTSDFCWRHGWHIKELMYILGMPHGAPKERYDWQLGDVTRGVREAALSLGLIDRREYIRLMTAAELASCHGDCEGHDSTSFCTGCSAAPVEEQPQPAELREAS